MSDIDLAIPFPAYFAVSCHWADPWLIVAATRPGRRHLTNGLPTDDAFLVTRCGPGVLLGIADGAGDPRASRSGEGAQRALAVAAATADATYRNQQGQPPSTSLVLAEALRAAHVSLAAIATKQRLDPLVFATTLTLAFLEGDKITAAKVGDNSMFLLDGKTFTRFCSSKQPSTKTPMITNIDWMRWQQTSTSETRRVTALAMCTDGAEDFFIGDRPDGFMVTALSNYCDKHGPAAATAFAMQMLNKNDFADAQDDRTFIIAIKPQTAEARPHARMSG